MNKEFEASSMVDHARPIENPWRVETATNVAAAGTSPHGANIGWSGFGPIQALPPRGPPGSEPVTILLVDDEPDILGSYQRVLELVLHDVRILTAQSAREALYLLAKNRCDLVISDFRMPEMDGVRLLREVRATLPNVARILLTAYPDPDVERRARDEAEVDHYLSKAGDLQHFLSTVRSTLGIPPDGAKT